MKAIHNYRVVARNGAVVVSVCKDTKLLKAIHNNAKKVVAGNMVVSVCKDTKLLKAIHNRAVDILIGGQLYQSAKILNFYRRLAAPQHTSKLVCIRLAQSLKAIHKQ